jgi:hypothetical protein
VYLKQRTFKLENATERMRFALELYNFSSTLHANEGDTVGQVKKLKDLVNQYSCSNNLQQFTNKSDYSTKTSEHSTQDSTSNYSEDQSESNASLKGNDASADEQLEDYGYKVVPDILETDGGTWEVIDKVQHTNHSRTNFSIHEVALTIVLQLPSHLRTVYLRRDPNQTEYIAKHVREGSNELAIHEYLQSRPSQSPHIISLIEAIPSTTREWLILPNLYSIRRQLFRTRTVSPVVPDSAGASSRDSHIFTSTKLHIETSSPTILSVTTIST